MLRLTIFAFILLIAFGFSSDPTRISANLNPKPFNVTIGMSVDGIRALYPDAQFIPESSIKYGICDSGAEAFDVVRNDSTLFFFWKHWELNKIGGFILLDPNQTFAKVHVGMKVSEVLTIYPKARSSINLISSKEDIYIQEKNCWFTLDSPEDNYAAEYIFENGESQFVKYIDMNKKVEWIFVKATD